MTISVLECEALQTPQITAGGMLVEANDERAGLLARFGSLEARLAQNASEISAAQEVRFRVFYNEMGASRSVPSGAEERDADRFDAICDHLLVFDTEIDGPAHGQIVGTYRLLRQECAAKAGGFYSNQEFALEALIARHPGRRFLELGRSCVLPKYRQKRTVELLWQGIWAYCHLHRIDVMAGCASFPGVLPARHAEALSFLAHNSRATGEWSVAALTDRYFPMDLMPAECISPKSAIGAMPPLVKGYLRLGAMFGEGCVIDPDFRTTDVFVVLPVEEIADRYIQHYGAAPS